MPLSNKNPSHLERKERPHFPFQSDVLKRVEGGSFLKNPGNRKKKKKKEAHGKSSDHEQDRTNSHPKYQRRRKKKGEEKHH